MLFLAFPFLLHQQQSDHSHDNEPYIPNVISTHASKTNIVTIVSTCISVRFVFMFLLFIIEVVAKVIV